MVYLKAKTIQQLWPSLLKRVMNGREVLDERGSKTKELLNVVWEVTDPEACEDPEGNPFGGQKLEEYKMQFLDKETHGHVYTYGNRLRAVEIGSGYQDTDQIYEATIHLKNHPETRRATATTWDRGYDPTENEIPCFIMVDFKIRDKKLFTTAVWRSHDAMVALPANFFALRELSRYVAKETKVEIGSITVQSISCHIYEPYWKEATKVVE